jgi:RNA methyltransferase, TrmH family
LITSSDNQQLKTIRKLHEKKHREREGLFLAEGEDLLDAARAAGWEPESLLVAGEDVEPRLLDAVSTLGSGTRAIGIFRQRWSEPGGDLSVYLHGVQDPGNVGTVIRSAHAFADGPVVLGPDCADPFSPKAVRASMGSVFARPPARAGFEELKGTTIGLQRGAGVPIRDLEMRPPMVLCFGAEREGLSSVLRDSVNSLAHIPIKRDGPDSLNVGMAAAIALYEARTRMAADV